MLLIAPSLLFNRAP